MVAEVDRQSSWAAFRLALLTVALWSTQATSQEIKEKEVLIGALSPIPNPNGDSIAFLRISKKRLLSGQDLDPKVFRCNHSGGEEKWIAEGFIEGWTDANTLLVYRNARAALVSSEGDLKREVIRETEALLLESERVAFLRKADTIAWVVSSNSVVGERGTIVGGPGEGADDETVVGNYLSPSPDGRYLVAISSNIGIPRMRVYDFETRKWANIGRIHIYPVEDSWEWWRPSWTPWFPDSTRLAFISEAGELTVCNADGSNRMILKGPIADAGLPAVSPDGRTVAYATFAAMPLKNGAAGSFWGSPKVWIIPVVADGKPVLVSEGPPDFTTLTLRWLGSKSLIFDRVSDELEPTCSIRTVSLP